MVWMSSLGEVPARSLGGGSAGLLVPASRHFSSNEATLNTRRTNQAAKEQAVEQSRRARNAFAQMSVASLEQRNLCLAEFEAQLVAREQEILEANERDMIVATAKGGATGRLFLKGKIASLCAGLKQVQSMPDALGNKTVSKSLSDGLNMYRVSTPVGVLLAIFESRPDAVAQIFGLAVKTGNTVILKGGPEASETILVLADAMKKSLVAAGLPEDAAQLGVGGEVATELLGSGLVDLVIARGSYAMVKKIQDQSTTPVLGHAGSLSHIYVDETADLEMAAAITRDAKTDYPQACNAVDTVLVHKSLMHALPKLADALHDCKVHACPRASILLGDRVVPASGDDFHTEWCDLTVNVKVVDSLAEAVEHIREHSSGMAEVIVTGDDAKADEFTKAVDAAGVYVNASSRFADGYRYGFGAEVAISTSKIHARGPVGLDGLLSYKYQVYGKGHTVGGPNPTKLDHKDISSA